MEWFLFVGAVVIGMICWATVQGDSTEEISDEPDDYLETRIVTEEQSQQEVPKEVIDDHYQANIKNG